jgi:hypothetical protein
MKNRPTLHEALAALGLTSARYAYTDVTGKRSIINEDGRTVARLSAHQAWDVLASPVAHALLT